MFEKLELVNFQRHEKLTLELGNITTIVGSSDTGKSAIIRALRWLLLNKPSGTSYIRRGAKQCIVTLTVDGHTVSKTRMKSKGVYSLDDEEYKAFGNEVPTSIANLVMVDEDNIQKQHDAPFWLALSTGELSRTLNQVVDLSLIDSTISNLNKRLRRATTEADVSETRLTELRKDRKALAFVKEMDADCCEIEHRHDALDKRIRKLERIESAATTYRATHAEWNAVRESYTGMECDTGRMGAVVRNVRDTRTAVDRLSKPIVNIRDAQRKLQQSEGVVEYVDGMQETADKIREYKKQIHRLDYLVRSRREAVKTLNGISNKSRDAEAELASVEICPTCGKPT